MIPHDIYNHVSRDQSMLREDSDAVTEELVLLGIPLDSQIAAYLERFFLPIQSADESLDSLIDLCEPGPEIRETTEAIRENFGLPDGLLVLSTAEGGGALLYDVPSGAVYDLDFDHLDGVRSGAIVPRWNSFFEFIREYVGLSSP